MFDGDLLCYKRQQPVCKPLQRLNFTACGDIFLWKFLQLAQIIHESIFGKHLFSNVPIKWNVTKWSFNSRAYRELCWVRAEVAICGTGSLSYGDLGSRQTHGTIPLSTSQQSAVLGLLEPEVVSLCLTAFDGFLSSCLLLPLACIFMQKNRHRKQL